MVYCVYLEKKRLLICSGVGVSIGPMGILRACAELLEGVRDGVALTNGTKKGDGGEKTSRSGNKVPKNEWPGWNRVLNTDSALGWERARLYGKAQMDHGFCERFREEPFLQGCFWLSERYMRGWM